MVRGVVRGWLGEGAVVGVVVAWHLPWIGQCGNGSAEVEKKRPKWKRKGPSGKDLADADRLQDAGASQLLHHLRLFLDS